MIWQPLPTKHVVGPCQILIWMLRRANLGLAKEVVQGYYYYYDDYYYYYYY